MDFKFRSGVNMTFINLTPYSSVVEPFLLPTDAHNVKKHRVIKTF